MSAKHTPGQWTVSELNATGEKDSNYIFIEPGVAVIERKVEGQNEFDMPDAILLAGAKDTLAALTALADKTEEFIEHLKSTGRVRRCFTLPALDAARVSIAAVNRSAT